ncbi:inositol 1,3,4,5,6-pentakisphosphate 2-kinase [Seminavis robusta]|uniref:Inositol-pentakisphosphate 2-kinase n=1 Tax=Seminavis robusta TaxID=568900 RepID=A0A9N8E572_9STRA|nr:inositol 1,3,4,5,6-pentakisphosphate 2-kinase [Seminavis robusta]|eukprot:Sro512_g157570.1 inositol 1,3,4,5,6-pentakisphosphate 2-kinase (591) ;mRNA; r:3912-5684
MEAKEWRYAGEGGKHALFSHCSDKDRSDWNGRLLRLDKKYLRLAAATWKEDGLPGNSQLTEGSFTTKQTLLQSDLFFLQHIIKRQFDRYLDLPESISLPWKFVKELRDQTLSTQPCPIPEARRKDWLCHHTKKHGQSAAKEGTPIGCLIPDYCRPKQPSMPFISVEIKPKAGYLASSPLVDPRHTAKFYRSRFVLLQTLDRLGYSDQVPRGWKQESGAVSKEEKYSSYNPLDLFSCDLSRIQRAFEALWDTPQNNFKLWGCNPWHQQNPVLVVADQHYRQTEPDATTSSHQALWQDLFGFASSAAGDDDDIDMCVVKPMLVDMLSSILHAESSFVEKLQQWQLLDLLDADGAILVYDRLVELCQGSHPEAQELLDALSIDAVAQAGGTAKTREEVLRGSPILLIPSTGAGPAFSTLCNEIRRFSDALRRIQEEAGAPNNDDKLLEFLQKEHPRSRAICLKLISQMESKEACCYLLQNWLLSLVVCDVSFFVTLQRMPPKGRTPGSSKGEKVCIVQKQSESSPGILEVCMPLSSNQRTDNDVGGLVLVALFQYEVKLIDCDQKPSKKLQSRGQKERVFQHLQGSEWENWVN